MHAMFIELTQSVTSRHLSCASAVAWEEEGEKEGGKGAEEAGGGCLDEPRGFWKRKDGENCRTRVCCAPEPRLSASLGSEGRRMERGGGGGRWFTHTETRTLTQTETRQQTHTVGLLAPHWCQAQFLRSVYVQILSALFVLLTLSSSFRLKNICSVSWLRISSGFKLLLESIDPHWNAVHLHEKRKRKPHKKHRFEHIR